MKKEFEIDDIILEIDGWGEYVVLESGPGSYCLYGPTNGNKGLSWHPQERVEKEYVLAARKESNDGD